MRTAFLQIVEKASAADFSVISLMLHDSSRDADSHSRPASLAVALGCGSLWMLHAGLEHASLQCVCSLAHNAVNAEVSLSEHRVSRFPSSPP